MTIGSSARYVCGDEERRAALRDRLAAGQTTLNGIDFLEVVDLEADDLVPSIDEYRQRILLLQCFTDAPPALTPEQTRINGGVRISPVKVQWVRRLDDLHLVAGDPQGEIPTAVRDFLAASAFDRFPRSRVLAVGTDAAGDYSRYRFEFVNHRVTDPNPHADFDPRLAAVDLWFKVECPSPLDCATPLDCPLPELDEPAIDYLAKDYTSFRRLMLDRLSATAPDWQERTPADQGIMLVELLAYVGDHLSYQQDAAATEAYLGTARRRISVRRHARLVDYLIDEGANARTWVVIEPESGADGTVVKGPKDDETVATPEHGTRLATRRPGRATVLPQDDLEELRQAGAVVFETLHDITLRSNHVEIPFYTWSDRDCCLPIGATTATLVGELGDLKPGDFLLFEEVKGPETGAAADADPSHRHVVRVLDAVTGADPLLPANKVTEISWDAADALPFPLCLSATLEDGTELDNVSVARGNLVLADHGCTLPAEPLPIVPEDDTVFRPLLSEGPLTHSLPLPDENDIQAPAAAFTTASKRGEPAIWLESGVRIWRPRRDLLSSGPFAEDFVAEIENDGRARLRFGDDVLGLHPAEGKSFEATYRVGNGRAGNIGAEALAHVLLNVDPGISAVRNPIPALGGTPPEALEEVRRYAPQAFRTQERAVTEADYSRMAERHKEVLRAETTFRYTGSWMTAFITVDRRGGLPVDQDFERELVDHMGRYRLAGWDVEVDGPRFVPLDLALHICLLPGYERSAVAQDLMRVLGCDVLPDGDRGLFHPDDWSFGQSVYLSVVLAAVEGVAGVESVKVVRFHPWGRDQGTEIDDAVLDIDRLEIARLDNDPSRPENGRIELEFGGGR